MSITTWKLFETLILKQDGFILHNLVLRNLLGRSYLSTDTLDSGHHSPTPGTEESPHGDGSGASQGDGSGDHSVVSDNKDQTCDNSGPTESNSNQSAETPENKDTNEQECNEQKISTDATESDSSKSKDSELKDSGESVQNDTDSKGQSKEQSSEGATSADASRNVTKNAEKPKQTGNTVENTTEDEFENELDNLLKSVTHTGSSGDEAGNDGLVNCEGEQALGDHTASHCQEHESDPSLQSSPVSSPKKGASVHNIVNRCV